MFLSPEVLEKFLAVFLALIAVLCILREKFKDKKRNFLIIKQKKRRILIQILIGLLTGVISGLIGVGGPVLMVPVLVFGGWPILKAVGVSQVLSVFASFSGTLNYLQAGHLSYSVALISLFGQLLGITAGSKVAHQLGGDKLKLILIFMLFILSIYFMN